MWEKALKAFRRGEAGEDVPGRGISLCKGKRAFRKWRGGWGNQGNEAGKEAGPGLRGP